MNEDNGQVETGQPAEPATTGQNPVSEGQTSNAAPASEEQTFFDPSDIADKPELQAAYKQMQAAFTKKMQGLSSPEIRQKLEAYDSFMQNPQQQIVQLAQRYGLTIAQAQQQVQQQQQQEFNPQSWEDVLSHFKSQAKQEILGELQPVFKEVQAAKKQSIEGYLDSNFSDWRQYESEMMETLQKHPSLSGDLGLLYRMSVPENVLTQRATQAAMKKLQNKTEAAQMTGNNNAQRKTTTVKKAASFAEAFEMARHELESKGMKPPQF